MNFSNTVRSWVTLTSFSGKAMAAVMFTMAWGMPVSAQGVDTARSDARPRGVIAELAHMSSGDGRFTFVEEQILQCMTGSGLKYTPEQPPTEERDSREKRQRQGFGISIPNAEAPATLVGLSKPDTPTSRRWDAQFTQCYEAAVKAADAKAEKALSALPPNLADEVRSLTTLSHPVLKDGIAKWSMCLASDGYDFHQPIEVLEFLQSETDRAGTDTSGQSLAAVQAKERDLAVADWDCQEQSNARAALKLVLESLQARASASGAPQSIFAQ